MILVFLGTVVPWRGTVRIRHLMRQSYLASADRLALYASTIAFQWLAAAVVFWRCAVHHVSATHLALSLGNSPRQTVLAVTLLTALLASTQVLSIRRLARSPTAQHRSLREVQLKLMPQNATERLAFLALVLTAAVCEEFLYRGFIQAAFQDLARGSLALGPLASAAFFSSAHLYQGKRGVITTFIVGLVFSAIRASVGSLLPTMLAHGVADLLAGLFAPSVLSRSATVADESGNRAPSK